MLRQFAVIVAFSALGHSAMATNLVDVDFNAGDNGNGVNPGVNASGAAATGSVGDIWNAANTQNGGPQTLVDSAGNSTPISLTWSASASWNIASNNSPNPALTNDFLFGTDVKMTSVPTGTYDLYVYCSDDVNQNGGRSTSFSLNGGTAQTVVQYADAAHWDNAATDPNNHGNYTLFTQVSPVSGVFDITFGGVSTINGFQLVQVPEPATIGALLVGAGLITRRRRT